MSNRRPDFWKNKRQRQIWSEDYPISSLLLSDVKLVVCIFDKVSEAGLEIIILHTERHSDMNGDIPVVDFQTGNIHIDFGYDRFGVVDI